MGDEILDPNQVAAMLKIKYRTVVRMAERGELPAFKLGDLWRFRKSDIDRYIQSLIDQRRKDRQ